MKKIKRAEINNSFLCRDQNVLDGIRALGYIRPSTVQETLIPHFIQNPPKNFSVATTSGSGKTLAACVAILNRVDVSKHYTQAIYVATSSESAYKAANVLCKLGAYKNVRIGMAVRNQKDFVVRFDFHILVGTPKELAGFRFLNVFDVEKLVVVVLDDADLVYTSVYIKNISLMSFLSVANCYFCRRTTYQKGIWQATSTQSNCSKASNISHQISTISSSTAQMMRNGIKCFVIYVLPHSNTAPTKRC